MTTGKQLSWSLGTLAAITCGITAWAASITGTIQLECIGDIGCPGEQSCLIFHGARTDWDTPALVTICAKRCGPESGGCSDAPCIHTDPGPDGFYCAPSY